MYSPTHQIKSRLFGVAPNGEPVYAWTLRNTRGMELEAISYGATITRLMVPDRHGSTGDVVLGFSGLEPYLLRHAYFGSTIGRVAGRITHSTFVLDGQRYWLTPNEPPNHLHGGADGFDRKLWRVDSTQSGPEQSSITFTCESCHGEEGYPGNVKVELTYSLTENDSFVLHFKAETDSPTPFNLTQHSYFNLGGEECGRIEGHALEIIADEYVLTEDNLTLTGRLETLDGKPNDFRCFKDLHLTIPQLFLSHGDLYRLRKTAPTADRTQPFLAARLLHRGNGRLLEVLTTEGYLQLYTGSALDGSLVGKSGHRYGPHAGLCLECHGYPDGVNNPALGEILLRPGKPTEATTIYRFSIAD